MADIVSFDPNKIMESIQESIKTQYVQLIPDAKWNEMIKKCIDSYFLNQKDHYNYIQSFDSRFVLDVKSIIEMKIREVCNKFLSKIYNNIEFENDPEFVTIIERIIDKCYEEFMRNFIRNKIGSALNVLNTI